MFSVVFEVYPKRGAFDRYLDLAKELRPILEGIDGFIDNERFQSSRRTGWVLSHSTWRDEKSVVRWRTTAKHHETQQRGRNDVFADYHLRVGEIVADSAPPAGVSVVEQRLDETEISAAKFATLTEVQPGPTTDVNELITDALPGLLGFDPSREGALDYDVFGSIYKACAPDLLARSARGRRFCGAPARWGEHSPPRHKARARLRHVRSTREPAILPRCGTLGGAA
jgi:heme-degrading monooxygenase HmoA